MDRNYTASVGCLGLYGHFNNIDSSSPRTRYVFPSVCVSFYFFSSGIYIFHSTGLMSPSVQLSHSVMSDSLRPHESQHARPPYPTPTPGVHPDSCPSSQLMPSSHLILCRPLLLLPPIPPSTRVSSNESTLHMRWPKYWSFSFSIIPMSPR